jgi:hypothetical protein
MGTIFRTRETEPYNHLMKFYKIEPLLEGCFMVLSPIFKIGPYLEPLLEMLLVLDSEITWARIKWAYALRAWFIHPLQFEFFFIQCLFLKIVFFSTCVYV